MLAYGIDVALLLLSDACDVDPFATRGLLHGRGPLRHSCPGAPQTPEYVRRLQPVTQPLMQPLIQPLMQPLMQPLVQPLVQSVMQQVIQPLMQPLVLGRLLTVPSTCSDVEW